MSVEEAMKQIERDEVFFGETGGVTLSGGECTASPEFSLAVLQACRDKGINTAIETCMYAPPGVMDEFAEAANSIIADIKLIDPERHREATGADNALILENFERLAQYKKELLVRIPLIPGYTADEENIKSIAEYVAGVNPKIPVELINFNPMCTGKYASLRRDFIENAPAHPFSNSQMKAFAKIVSDCGLQVK
jgi:pyruvate formate lyase activating enzyme